MVPSQPRLGHLKAVWRDFLFVGSWGAFIGPRDPFKGPQSPLKGPRVRQCLQQPPAASVDQESLQGLLARHVWRVLRHTHIASGRTSGGSRLAQALRTSPHLVGRRVTGGQVCAQDHDVMPRSEVLESDLEHAGVAVSL